MSPVSQRCHLGPCQRLPGTGVTAVTAALPGRATALFAECHRRGDTSSGDTGAGTGTPTLPGTPRGHSLGTPRAGGGDRNRCVPPVTVPGSPVSPQSPVSPGGVPGGGGDTGRGAPPSLGTPGTPGDIGAVPVPVLCQVCECHTGGHGGTRGHTGDMGGHGGTRGDPVGAQPSLPCAVRSCFAFPAGLVPHPTSGHGAPHQCRGSPAGAGLRPARGPAGPAWSGGRDPPEEGAGVTNFPKLPSGPLRCPYGDGEEKKTKSCLQKQKLRF